MADCDRQKGGLIAGVFKRKLPGWVLGQRVVNLGCGSKEMAPNQCSLAGAPCLPLYAARRIAANVAKLPYFVGSSDAGGASDCGWSATGGGSKTSGCDRGNVHPVELAVTRTTNHAIFNNALFIVRNHLEPNADRILIDLREFKRRPTALRPGQSRSKPPALSSGMPTARHSAISTSKRSPAADRLPSCSRKTRRGGKRQTLPSCRSCCREILEHPFAC